MISAAHKASVRTAVLTIPFLLVAVAALQARIDATTNSIARPGQQLLLRSGAALKKISLGYNGLLADIYWTRAVQYYGARVAQPGANYDLLWPLLDVATTLDPHLIVAYRFGAIFLSEPYAGANRTDLAIELVKRGIAANPKEWRLGTDLGLLYYLRARDYPKAAEAYLEASKNPEAPAWIKMLAARIAEKGGSLETSRVIWSELYQSTSDPTIKKNALKQLASLKAQQDESQLDQLVTEYAKHFGHDPAKIQDMVAAGMLGGTPVDPAGFPYVLGSDGKTHLNPASSVEIIPPPKLPAPAQ
ncbi:MAG TPA: hypothetical protein VG322_00695 [Candidatus Acidoferrales bacterium]|nr:hypothetical protein [Candidatus Acidoferrales bacterium]